MLQALGHNGAKRTLDGHAHGTVAGHDGARVLQRGQHLHDLVRQRGGERAAEQRQRGQHAEQRLRSALDGRQGWYFGELDGKANK